MYLPEFKTDPILLMEELSNIVDKVLSFDCYHRKCFKQVFKYIYIYMVVIYRLDQNVNLTMTIRQRQCVYNNFIVTFQALTYPTLNTNVT